MRKIPKKTKVRRTKETVYCLLFGEGVRDHQDPAA
jgi:hypothetical protein